MTKLACGELPRENAGLTVQANAVPTTSGIADGLRAGGLLLARGLLLACSHLMTVTFLALRQRTQGQRAQ